MDESEIQQLIMIDAVGFNCHLMRNNSGQLKTQDGRFVRFGLGNVSSQQNERIKSSDLIGFTKITVGPEHLGQTFAVFTACEIKAPEWSFKPNNSREIAQRAFIKWINASGGIAGFCDSVASFRRLLGVK